jgi:hydrogenase maturation protein HypF
LGDLEYYPVQRNFENTLSHINALLQVKPDYILIDAHPDYFTSRLGKEMSQKEGIPFLSIQHHKAHFAAVLAENNLIKEEGKILGVIWDGTGYGDDGSIWGCEFFLFDEMKIKRAYHLEYYPHLARDKMPKEPRLSAFCVCHNIPGCEYIIKPKFNKEEWRIYRKLIRANTLNTSSMGRLFDAVSSLLSLTDYNSYEGEAPIYLERIARGFFEQSQAKIRPYSIEIDNGKILLKSLLTGILSDIRKGREKGFIALRFHLTLVEIVARVAKQAGAEIVAFSGGVFQNAFLLDRLIGRLSKDYKLCFHEQLSPNDECISYGQLAYFYMQMKLNN